MSSGDVVDGLMENDQYGKEMLFLPWLRRLVCLKDGLTYTYKLRKGVKWYTSEGEEYQK